MEINKILPCFTPNEMIELGVFGESNFYNVKSNITQEKLDFWTQYKSTGIVDNNYYNIVENAYKEYIDNPTDENKQNLLEWGWNPEVDINMIDLNVLSSLTESKLYEEIPMYGVDVIDISNESTFLINEDAIGEYLYNGNTSYLDQVYNLSGLSLYINTSSIPSFIDKQSIEDSAYNKAKSINKNFSHHKKPNYPFKCYEVCNCSKEDLIDMIRVNKKGYLGINRALIKIYQYNFKRDKLRISTLVVADKNTVYSVYLLLNGNTLINIDYKEE